ncbi:MAG: tetratricopeptide repeat protein [Desulfobacterales bacterium]
MLKPWPIFVKIAHTPAFLKKLTPKKSAIKLIAREAEEFERTYLKLAPNRSATSDDLRSSFQEVRGLIAGKKYIDGLNLLAKIIDGNPQNPEAVNLMGEIYERLGKTAEAVELQNMATQLSG